MANYKSLRLTTPHGVVENPPAIFTPATYAVTAREADGSLTPLTLTVVGVGGPKDIVLDLGLNPCCTKIISGEYIVCPALAPEANTCVPPLAAPDLVDVPVVP